MTFGFGFCSVLYGVTRVQFRFLDIFYFRFGSVLGKTWVLVRFVLAVFGLFPTISLLTTSYYIDVMWKGVM